MDRWLADTSARYVDRLRDLARRLDTAARRQADGTPTEHWPEIHDAARWLRPLFYDLKPACHQAGEAGDAIFLAAVRVRDEVSKVVADYRGSGSVDAWTSCRDRVLEDLDAITAAGGARSAVEVFRAATAVSPPATKANVLGHIGDSSEQGNDAATIAAMLGRNPRAILRVLIREGAISMLRSWSSRELSDHLTLTDGQMRRALDTLREHGLYESRKGQDGGIWLTDMGVSVADLVK